MTLPSIDQIKAAIDASAKDVDKYITLIPALMDRLAEADALVKNKSMHLDEAFACGIVLGVLLVEETQKHTFHIHCANPEVDAEHLVRKIAESLKRSPRCVELQ